MTEEEKAKAEADAKAEAEAKAKTEAEGQNSSSQNNTDVEAALKSERERREKAERDLEETRKKARERIEKKKEEFSMEEPLTRENVRQLLDEERENLRKELREERVRELAKKLSKSDSEAELVMEVWKNRTLAGTLDEQIEEAFAIATYKQSIAQSNELKRALASKSSVITDGLNAQRKPIESGAPELPVADKSVVAGMTWDNARGAYRKLIAKGTKVFFVSKDLKKRWTEDAPQK